MNTRAHLIDLSHPIVSGRPGYPGLPAPSVGPYISHAASRDAYGGQAEFEISRLYLVGNTGTYLDSPYHRYPHGSDISELPLATVAGLRGLCLDAELDPDGRRVSLGPRALALMPAGIVHEGAALLVRTGWSDRYGSDAYWMPGPHLDLSLVDRIIEARIGLVGVDFWNVDDPGARARPVHTRLLGAGIPIVEHLTHLHRVPESGFRFHAAPLAVVGAASMPVRAYGEVDA